jgi:hypothetical protein
MGIYHIYNNSFKTEELVITDWCVYFTFDHMHAVNVNLLCCRKLMLDVNESMVNFIRN